jgi:hypothetical protein
MKKGTSMVTTAMAGHPFALATLGRRICSWCGSDLGALEHQSQHHSYGICESCAHQYFAYLYEPEASLALAAVNERQFGRD